MLSDAEFAGYGENPYESVVMYHRLRAPHGFSPASDHLRLIVEVRLGCGLVFQRQAPADVLPNVSTGIAPIIGGKLGAEPVLIVEENGSRSAQTARTTRRTNQ
ncbi:hypothetical protein [Nocardia abscessus]|uniref:hypothetical protein n=1 Tax=Nocardia abscessus TaxID=120957 RepID=UPI002453A968|nr:hypothetical protein [Nocardia abscessus]